MKVFKFYGVCSNQYKLDDVIWEALEDPGDGYRSYLGSIVQVDSDGIFFQEPLADVTVEKVQEGNFDGFKIIDLKDNHVWLEVGTEDYDDYYPCFTFRYQPRPEKLKWEEFIQ